MSVSAVRWAIKQKTGDASAKSVLRMLAWHHNPEGGLCCPSLATLQDECDIKSVNTVKSALKRLVALGLISFEREIENGAIKRTRYALLGFDPSNADGVSVADGGSNIDGGSSIDRGATADGGVYQELPLPSVKDCPSVHQNLTPKEKVEREEKEETSTCPAFAEAVEDFGLDDFSLQPETKTEPVKAVKAVKKAKKSVRSLVKPADCSQEVFDEWVAYKDSLKGKSKCSQRMVNFIVKEAQTARITSERAMVICMEHGWISFEARFFKGSELEPAVNPFLVTPEQKQSIFAARQYREQSQPEFRNIKANKAPFDDEFDAGAVDLLKGVM